MSVYNTFGAWRMRLNIAAVLTLVLLSVSACQTTSGGRSIILDQVFIDEFGFSESTQSYMHEYREIVTIRVMAISKLSGSKMYQSYPSNVFQQGDIINDTLRKCQVKFGEECILLANENALTREGLVVLGKTLVNPAESARIFSSKFDPILCRSVITRSRPAVWSEQSNSAPAVAQAKKRGLTPEKCVEILDY